MAFEIGATIGGYEFIDVLNNNPKTGITYKVRNVKFGRLEMLRILPLNLQGDQEKVDRFIREVKVHARLSHPHIITFYNATEIEGQLVMTMELVEGTPLAGRLELGALPAAEAIDYVNQVLSALGYAHKQKIVHRDVTPANILVTQDKLAMLGGFGMAKASTDPSLTQTGTAVGVAQYMSPEQVKGVNTLDGRSDLYAAGVVLYEAVTGQVPFNASSQFEVMLAHVNSAPKAPSAVKSGLPEGLDEVILKALAKDPAQRFQTAAEFTEALGKIERVSKDEPAVKPVSIPVSAKIPSPAAMAARAGSSRPATIAATSVLEPPKMKPPAPPAAKAPAEAAAAVRNLGLAAGGARARQWSMGELILGGVLTSALLTLVFLAIMTVSGMLHVKPGS